MTSHAPASPEAVKQLGTGIHMELGAPRPLVQPLETYISVFTLAGILAHLTLAHGIHAARSIADAPLYAVLVLGGLPLLWDLARKLIKREFGSDLLAGLSIFASVLLGQYLVGCIVVLMLSGGAALEAYTARRASSVLNALARRVPQVAHRKVDSRLVDVSLAEIAIGEVLVVLPHEICPVDGEVVEGHGVMDEAYLTGEPFVISKTPGAQVLSGAINGETALTIRAQKLTVDSRYAMIMKVMQESEQRRPRLRRLGDQLGALYTPLAIALAVTAGLVSGSPLRFLAVLVVATPCPLLIGIPVAVIGAISLAARRGIIIKNPAALEQITRCRTLIFDKTGTLTFGRPALTGIVCAPGFMPEEVLLLAATLEQYSKHPLAGAVLRAGSSAHLALKEVSEISERPGEGLTGIVAGKRVKITGRRKVAAEKLALPPLVSGLECLVFIDGAFAAAMRFHDAPRSESRPFIKHLMPHHGVSKVMLVSGDRESEVRYLADAVGITDVRFSVSPEEKVAIVNEEMRRQHTLFVGDGINDAPALMAATVGVAFGHSSDIVSEAAGAVVMTASIGKVDELIHIGRRMRRVALQSAVGGMALSLLGMAAAALGFLPPLEGAIVQELIDLAAVLNSVRVSLPAGELTDF